MNSVLSTNSPRVASGSVRINVSRAETKGMGAASASNGNSFLRLTSSRVSEARPGNDDTTSFTQRSGPPRDASAGLAPAESERVVTSNRLVARPSRNQVEWRRPGPAIIRSDEDLLIFASRSENTFKQAFR